MKQFYIIPEIDIVPYQDPLLDEDPVALGSMGVNDGGALGKKFDDFEENDSYEDELWKDEREGFGLQDWDTNYEQ